MWKQFEFWCEGKSCFFIVFLKISFHIFAKGLQIEVRPQSAPRRLVSYISIFKFHVLYQFWYWSLSGVLFTSLGLFGLIANLASIVTFLSPEVSIIIIITTIHHLSDWCDTGTGPSEYFRKWLTGPVVDHYGVKSSCWIQLRSKSVHQRHVWLTSYWYS